MLKSAMVYELRKLSSLIESVDSSPEIRVLSQQKILEAVALLNRKEESL